MIAIPQICMLLKFALCLLILPANDENWNCRLISNEKHGSPEAVSFIACPL